MKDNCIGKDVKHLSDLDFKILKEYPKAEGWLPFHTYDMVQCGYPCADHGEMIIRTDGGCNENGELLPSNGMWCKVEDVLKFLKE